MTATALSTVSHGPSRYPMVRDLVVPSTEPSRFAAGELGKSRRNLEEIGSKFLGPNRFGVFLKKWWNAYLDLHDLGNIGKLEANLETFNTPLSRESRQKRTGKKVASKGHRRDKQKNKIKLEKHEQNHTNRRNKLEVTV